MSETPVSDWVANAKNWYESKTIIGIIIAAVSTLVGAFFPEVDIQGAANEVIDSSTEIAAGVDSLWVGIGQVVGLALAAWGRFKAKVGIK